MPTAPATAPNAARPTIVDAPGVRHRKTLLVTFALARSISSSPRPESTLLSAYRLNPLTWSRVIFGGKASSWRAAITSTSALPVVCERRPERVRQVVGMFDSLAVHPERLCHCGEVGIGQVGAEVHETAGLHLELDEAERAVVEHDDLHREVELLEGDQVAEHHRQTPVAGERDDLAAGLRRLHADRLRHARSPCSRG